LNNQKNITISTESDLNNLFDELQLDAIKELKNGKKIRFI